MRKTICYQNSECGIEYEINADALFRTTYECGEYNRETGQYDFPPPVRKKLLQVGGIFTLASSTYVGPNRDRDSSPRYYLASANGVAGNSNRDILRTEGWRGTTDDVSCDAHGLWRVEKIIQRKRHVSVVLRRL